MRNKFLLILSLLAAPAYAGQQVILETSLGEMTLELLPEKAPQTVANFLQYVDGGFYDQSIFHRIIPGYIIQAGGFDTKLHAKKAGKPIINEARQSIGNRRATVAMARSSAPNSATSQFFINLKDNPNLDYQSSQQTGYAVFATVIKGMDVADKISQSQKNNLAQPNYPIIHRAYRHKTAP